MLNVNVYNMKGEVCGSMELNEKIFGANESFPASSGVSFTN